MEPVLRDALTKLSQNRVSKAENAAKSVLLADYSNALAWYICGLCALKREDLYIGIAAIEKALSLNPNIAEAHQNLGVAFSRISRFDDAISHWRQAIAINPASGESYQCLSEVRALSPNDAEYAAARELSADEGFGSSARRAAAFSVATALHGAGQFSEAFDFYLLGNQLADAKSDVAIERELLRRSEQVFDANLFSRLGNAQRHTISPIFVIGMPRSGTTLTEQILSSHSKIGGAGELSDFTGMVGSIAKIANGEEYPEVLKSAPESLNCKIIADFAKQYCARLAEFDRQAQFVVDKAPNNYRFLGFISLMFPAAPIIYCQRSPMDIGLSCYQANFANGQTWSFSLEGIAEKLKSHTRFIDFWRQVLPNPIHTVRYETLVSHPEGEARRLLDFCGVAWEDQCARPHDNSSQVQTASKWQVRQPINKSSIDRWRRYESELAPLRLALGNLAKYGPD